MAAEPHRLHDRRPVGEGEHGRRAARDPGERLRRPVDESHAVDRERRRAAAGDGDVEAAARPRARSRSAGRGWAARRAGFVARGDRLALGGRARRTGCPPPRPPSAGRTSPRPWPRAACRTRVRSARPGPSGTGCASGANGSHGWPSTATIRVVAPSIPTLVRRAVAALPSLRRTRAPGRALSRSGAAAPLANTRPPRRPAAARDRRVGEVVLDPALVVDAPVRQHDRRHPRRRRTCRPRRRRSDRRDRGPAGRRRSRRRGGGRG